MYVHCLDLYDKFLSGEIDASAHRHDLGNHSKFSCIFTAVYTDCVVMAAQTLKRECMSV